MNRQKIVKRYRLPTSIAAVAGVLDSLSGKKYLAIEEGPMSGWLYRNLHRKVERFVVADPRRNKLMWGMWKRRCQFGSDKAALREMVQHNAYVLS